MRLQRFAINNGVTLSKGPLQFYNTFGAYQNINLILIFLEIKVTPPFNCRVILMYLFMSAYPCRWKGDIGGKLQHYFPSNYVKEVANSSCEGNYQVNRIY